MREQLCKGPEEVPVARTREKGQVVRGNERFGAWSPRASQAWKKLGVMSQASGLP